METNIYNGVPAMLHWESIFLLNITICDSAVYGLSFSIVHSARLLEIETAIRQEQSPVSNQFTDKNKTTNSGGIWILVIDVSWYPTSDCGLYI